MSLAAKLVEIMAEVERVAKRGKNDFHKYDYATESDITAAIREHLISRKLLILPRVSKWATMDKPGDKGQLVYVDMVFTIHDAESGEAMDFPWLGCGEDKGDKGLYKGYTGAEKYFLLKLFLIPTGDDPEQEPKGRNQKPEPKAEPKAEAPKVSVNGDTLTAEQMEKVFKVAKSVGYTKPAELRQFTESMFGVESVRFVPKSGFERLLKAIAPDMEAVTQ